MTGEKTRACACGNKMRKKKASMNAPFHYTMSGLSDVSLVGIEIRHCPNCGREEPVIPKLGQLHKLLAQNIIQKDSLLTGEEIRFLRRNVGISAREFAGMLGITPVHLSKAENGHRKLGDSADKLARAIALAAGSEPVRDLLIAHVRKSIERGTARKFRISKDGWKAAA